MIVGYDIIVHHFLIQDQKLFRRTILRRVTANLNKAIITLQILTCSVFFTMNNGINNIDNPGRPSFH